MGARRVRWLLCTTAIAALMPGTALPAAADPPARQRVTFAAVVSDQGQARGDPLSWAFTGEAPVNRCCDLFD
jgi:hypothetical protein